MNRNYNNTTPKKNSNNATREILKNLNDIYDGTLTIIKQDGCPIQYNLNEKFYCGDYLC